VRVLMSGLDTERLVLSGGPIGLMQAALDIAIPYARERKQFNAPIGTFGIMQAKIADMYTKLQSSRGFAYMVAKQFDAGVKSRIDPAACLLNASQNAVQVALEAIQTLGGNGYINEYPTGRLLRDAKLYEIGAGTNEIRAGHPPDEAPFPLMAVIPAKAHCCPAHVLPADDNLKYSAHGKPSVDEVTRNEMRAVDGTTCRCTMARRGEGLAPSPLRGEGWGEGRISSDECAVRAAKGQKRSVSTGFPASLLPLTPTLSPEGERELFTARINTFATSRKIPAGQECAKAGIHF
jgi:hypothetical protein